jgi:cyclophilin family peptidyl-prolyl cis-trans isomerase
MMSGEYCVIDTSHGSITLRLRADCAPSTVDHFSKLVGDRLYDGCCFYRSDFVIQCGLQRPDGSAVPNPHPAIQTNETKLTNGRGTAAFGHWDVPDCGNSDFFINLKHNSHLDTAYGGYAVFMEIEADDATSLQTVDKIAAAVLAGSKPLIRTVRLGR